MSTDGDGFERPLRRGWDAGRAQWPQVDYSFEDFSRFVKESLASRGLPETEASLQKLVLRDLYLVGACLEGVPGASEALVRYLKEGLPGLLHRLLLSPSQLEDLLQNLFIHLLVGLNGGGPRLKAYKGEGSLLPFCATIVLRMAIRERKVGPETLAGDLLETIGELPDPGKTPEEALRKRLSLHDFKRAVHGALDTLPYRRLLMLWLYLCKRMSMTEVGRYCGVHQSSVSRELENARQDIYAGTQHLLQLSSSEFSSLLEEVRSQMDVGLSRFLRDRFPSSSSSSSSDESSSGSGGPAVHGT